MRIPISENEWLILFHDCMNKLFVKINTTTNKSGLLELKLEKLVLKQENFRTEESTNI